MKKIAILIAGLSAAIAVPAAAAPHPAAPRPMVAAKVAPWVSIKGREAQITAKINQGIRSGALTRREATQLRAQFNAIVSLETRYRLSRPGLTIGERADLDRRFDALDRSIRIEKHDRDYRDHRGGRR